MGRRRPSARLARCSKPWVSEWAWTGVALRRCRCRSRCQCRQPAAAWGWLVAQSPLAQAQAVGAAVAPARFAAPPARAGMVVGRALVERVSAAEARALDVACRSAVGVRASVKGPELALGLAC